MLSPQLIIGIDATVAEIPSGFTRITALDGKFPKGAAAGLGGGSAGGNAVHQHTSPAHSHILESHAHSFSINQWNNYNFTSSNKNSVPSETDKSLQDAHIHSGTSDAAQSTTNQTALTYGAVSNNPPYYGLIFIRSDKYNYIPNKGVVLSAQTVRSGLAFLAAAAGKFLRGATAGANAGESGGSVTNVHPINHGHTPNPHNHSALSSLASYLSRHGFGASGSRIGNHQHSFTFDNTTVPINDFAGSLTTPETVEPAHRTLNAFKNASGGNLMAQPGDIALFMGTPSQIPIGWVLCDGNNGTPDMRDKFLKIPASAAASTIGGSNTHSHAGQAHQHTNSPHNHTKSPLTDYGQTYSSDNTGEGGDLTGGSHTVTIANSSAAYGPATTTADAANNEPEYVTVLFVQMKFLPIVGAAVLVRR